MDLSVTLTKRKCSDLQEDENFEVASQNSKVSKRADSRLHTVSESTEELAVIISGKERRLSSYNPLFVNRQLNKLLGGSYEGIRVLSSGDLALQRSNRYELS